MKKFINQLQVYKLDSSEGTRFSDSPRTLPAGWSSQPRTVCADRPLQGPPGGGWLRWRTPHKAVGEGTPLSPGGREREEGRGRGRGRGRRRGRERGRERGGEREREREREREGGRGREGEGGREREGGRGREGGRERGREREENRRTVHV